MPKKTEEEVTDDELLAEIVKETTMNNNNSNTINNLNDTTIKNNQYDQYEGGAQLTTFQDNIITTGSDVSILLMVILLILFIIQMVRKTYNYFTFESKIQSVVNPLDDAKPMAAENLTPINPRYDHKSYAVYNTEFEDRKLYLQKQAEGANPSVLKEILLARAVKCIQKARAMQRDGVGIRKNWNMDLLPRDVWEDFNAAQRNIQAEVECVARENGRLQFQWGSPHKNNIFSKAKEIHERNMMLQNKAFHERQRQMQIQMQQMHKNKNKNKNKNKAKAPNAKSFGSGFNTGFYNNAGHNNNSNQQQSSSRLTKKEKQELKRQKKAMKNSNQATMLKDNIVPTNNSSQQTQPRRRKPKRRFATK